MHPPTDRRGPRAPWRWTLAGRVSGRLPDVRGRLRIRHLLAGTRGSDAVVQVRLPGPDVSLLADLAISPHLYFLQYTPPALGPVIDAVMRPGDRAIDVGANEGIYTCWMARRAGAAGEVIAFEPVPATRARLTANVELNGFEDRVTVVPAAVGAEAGSITIWAPERLHVLAGVGAIDGATPIEVAVETLDDRVAGRDVRLVKIDVEGYEPAVLRGAHELLNGPNPPILLVEVLPSHLQRLGFSVTDVLGPLHAAGYVAYELTPRGLREVQEGRPHSPNLLALQPEAHAAELRALQHHRFARDQTH